MKRRFYKTKEVFKIKNNLLKIAPQISDIDIKVKNLKNGQFKTKIHVNIPSKKPIISSKTDELLNNSLEKAHHAAIKQIQKVMAHKFKRQTIRKIEMDMAA